MGEVEEIEGTDKVRVALDQDELAAVVIHHKTALLQIIQKYPRVTTAELGPDAEEHLRRMRDLFPFLTEPEDLDPQHTGLMHATPEVMAQMAPLMGPGGPFSQ